MEAVDPYVAIGHHSIKLDEHALTLVVRRQDEMLAIPADAGREKAARAARRVILVEWSFNAPIVGHVQLPPAAVVKGRLLSTRGIRFEKTPIAVERFDCSNRRRTDSYRPGGGQSGQQADNQC